MKRIVILLCTLATLGVSLAGAQGKFSGLVFGDYFYNVAKDTGFSRLSRTVVPGNKDFQAFQIRRIYFTYDNDMSDKFTARFRLEGNMLATENGSSATASRLSGSSLSQLFIKDAYLKWKNVFAGSDLIFGVQPTTAYEISEGVWGYRSLEKTIMDLRGIIPSRDLGLALRGKFDDGGMFMYWFMVANNSGQDDAVNRYKRVSLNLQVKPVKNVIVTLDGDYRTADKINDPASTTAPKATLPNNVMVFALFAAYNDPTSLTLGAEFFVQSVQNGLADPADLTGKTLKTLQAFGLSVFGTYWFTPEIGLIGRYDIYNPNTESGFPMAGSVSAPGYAASLTRNYLIAGLSFKPDKNVQIIPNIQMETYQAPRNVTNAVSIDASVTARVTFYWVFL
jgi:hypothetical protein